MYQNYIERLLRFFEQLNNIVTLTHSEWLLLRLISPFVLGLVVYIITMWRIRPLIREHEEYLERSEIEYNKRKYI